MVHKVEIDGVETEVYTAAERQADIDAAKAATEGEWKPKMDAVTTDLTEARKALGERTTEFAQFRKLNTEQVAQLAEKDRIIYQNQLSINEEREKFAATAKTAHEAAITSVIKTKVGSDEKLAAEARKMYDLVGLEDLTPEQIAIRADAAIGALARTQPDLLAAAGLGSGGNFEPPRQGDETTSFADTPAGKQLANELGIQTEYTPEQKKALGLT